MMDEGWIEWKGGECPVDPSSKIDTKHRGCESGGISLAGHWTGGKYDYWKHEGKPKTNIIAYRIVK